MDLCNVFLRKQKKINSLKVTPSTMNLNGYRQTVTEIWRIIVRGGGEGKEVKGGYYLQWSSYAHSRGVVFLLVIFFMLWKLEYGSKPP